MSLTDENGSDLDLLFESLESAISSVRKCKGSSRGQLMGSKPKTKCMDESPLAPSGQEEIFYSCNEKVTKGPRIHCERTATVKDDFEVDYLFSDQQQHGFWPSFRRGLRSCCSCSSENVKRTVQKKVPVLKWLPKYNWRKDFIWDVVSGCTVAVMQIPQGLGYAMLGNVPPVVGIYMAFFPVLIYFFFGTSRHISLGTLSVVTLMCGRIVTTYAHDHHDVLENNTLVSSVNATSPDDILTPIQVAMAISFLVGLWQLLMHALQLGVLGLLLSDSLVSGFTTAAAVHVLTSQIKNLLGIRVPKFTGKFAILYTFHAIFENITNTNMASLVTSIVTISFLVFHNEVLKPIYSKRTKIPVPIEMIVLVAGTLVSRFIGMKENYQMKVVDVIPTGIPKPEVPPIYFLHLILMDTLSIAIVAYAISLSMAKILAKKHKYQVEPNQELLAHGLANVGGSFFSSMPVAASLSRSLIQEAVGGRTQIASVISCLLLLMVLLFIGPFFEPLPLAVLASIIFVALKGMIVQVADFKKALRTSPWDAFVWASAFLGTVLIDIDLGLVIGVSACVFCLVYQGQKPHACLLGNVPGTELYLDTKKYKSVNEDPEIKIFHWNGGIHFANADSYIVQLNKLVPIPDAPKLTSPLTVMVTGGQGEASEDSPKGKESFSPKFVNDEGRRFLDNRETGMSVTSFNSSEEQRVNFVVLDLSSVSYVDLAGSKAIATVIKDLREKGVATLIVCQSGSVLRRMESCDTLSKFSRTCLFPTVADAVTIAQSGLVPRVL